MQVSSETFYLSFNDDVIILLLTTNWQGYGRKRWWPNYAEICLASLKNCVRNINLGKVISTPKFEIKTAEDKAIKSEVG